jgi:tryptophanyl-tRNA synthetase
MKKRALTGIKPTGTPHIGNYVGALKPLLDFAANPEYEVNCFLADYHCLNDVKARTNLGQLTLELAATLLALGFDPKGCTFYRQSDVPETFELTSFLTNFTPKGLMNRAHAYKAVVQTNHENGQTGDDEDIGVNMGLYNYPILMSADILLFDSDLVPVGRDQRQHIEFARDIAGSVNAVYGEGTCKLPEGIISEATMEIPGLDGRKMSKSYGNVLPIFAEASEIEKICKRVKTDSKLPEEPKDKDNLVYILYRALATPAELADFEARFLPGGMGYGDAKKELAALHEAKFGQAREEYKRLMNDPGYVNNILLEGAAKARDIAAPVLKRIRQAAGFYV